MREGAGMDVGTPRFVEDSVWCCVSSIVVESQMQSFSCLIVARSAVGASKNSKVIQRAFRAVQESGNPAPAVELIG